MNDNVTHIADRNTHIDYVGAPRSVTRAELRALIDWMGLTRIWFANRLGITERTVVRWIDGGTQIPEEAGVELVKLWNKAADQIGVIVAAGVAAAVDGVVTLKTFRVDKEYHAAVGSNEFPAGWHRALTCRAMDHLLMKTKYVVVIDFWEAGK